MKRVILLVMTAVLLFSLPAFAAGNNVVFSSDADSATFVIEKDQLERDHTDSAIKYYTFSVSGLTVRADKNNFYDHGITEARFSLGKRAFSVTFTYADNSKKPLTELLIPARFTVTGDDVTPYTVPVFGDRTVTVDKASEKEAVFETSVIGKFSMKKFEFSDVKDASSWYYKYVNSCAALGVLSGMGDGSFAPQKTVTRAQLCVMIVRSTEDIISYRTDDKIKFSDVKAGSWYYDAVMKCAALGIVYGESSTQFAPDKPATREQIAAVVARVVNIVGIYGGKPLPDVSNTAELSKLYADHGAISNYAKQNVLLCNKLKIMVGDAQGFRPKANTTRAECAVIFHTLKNSFNY